MVMERDQGDGQMAQRLMLARAGMCLRVQNNTKEFLIDITFFLIKLTYVIILLGFPHYLNYCARGYPRGVLLCIINIIRKLLY
jgi:hypothetical protein